MRRRPPARILAPLAAAAALLAACVPPGERSDAAPGAAAGPPPTLASVVPASGTSAGGTIVGLHGSGFAAGAAVSIGGSAAASVHVEPGGSEIWATTPAGTVGPADVVVTNPDGPDGPDGQSVRLAGGFAFVAGAGPAVTAVSPGGGPSSGGTLVTISGGSFSTAGTTTVHFGSTPSSSVTVLDSVTLAAVAPPGAPGAVVLVSVTSPGGLSGTAAGAFAYDVWSSTGTPLVSRSAHAATRLADGRVLLCGGTDLATGSPTASAEVYDPATGTFASAGSLLGARAYHTATLLPDGRVLAAGGAGAVPSAEIYDPASGTWTGTGALGVARYWHTATLLGSGRVLVSGGVGSGAATSEIYDPATGTWSATGALVAARYAHAAARLGDGRVVALGGVSVGIGVLSSAEVYDPSAGTWTAAGSLAQARERHTATRLPSGRLLAVGGIGPGGTTLASAELYDPATATWTAAGALAAVRYSHAAVGLPDGSVLVDGGYFSSSANPSAYAPGAERYDESTGRFRPRATGRRTLVAHAATLLADGSVLLTGPDLATGSGAVPATLYREPAAAWSPGGGLPVASSGHTATPLPDGRLLVAGGWSGIAPLSRAALWDPGASSSAPSATSAPLAMFAATGSLATGRAGHTATLLASGRVLVAGGLGATGSLASAESYDPASGLWTATASLAAGRAWHTATLLASGRVLAAGGESGGSSLATAEIHDPSTGTWAPAGSLAGARARHAALLLPDGRVLVVGGVAGGVALASVEVFDPAVGTWSATGALAVGRSRHAAVRLPGGDVLACGGWNAGALASAEVYRASAGTWTTAAPMRAARLDAPAVALGEGRILVAGGNGPGGPLAGAEFFDPAAAASAAGLGAWLAAPPLARARAAHSLTRLPDGRVIAVGDESADAASPAEVFTAALPASGRPDVTRVDGSSLFPVTLVRGGTVTLSGNRFRGAGEGGSGTHQSSASDAPLVRLWGPLGGGCPADFAFPSTSSTDGTGATFVLSTPGIALPPGAYALQVGSGGAWSDPRIVQFP